MEMTKDDKMLLAGAEDKYRQCSQQYRVAYTNFLDLHQRSLVEKHWHQLSRGNKDVRCVFYGGYEDAERTLAVFLPDYADERDCPLSVIRIKTPTGGRKLTHRDYLGSLTGIGLKREMIGDILTTEEGADVIILDEIKDFLLLNYSKAGRAALKLESIPLSELHIPEERTVIVKDTVASLRLDNVTSSAFSMSRSKATEAIRSGIVFVNSVQAEKPDMQINEGDKLVLRGKGKAYLSQVGKRTRKDRIFIEVRKYV
ncbi:MAG: RNA-binding protein [Clostridiales bacterium]|nr:RNA-binding protein [Clostridiales bacterium]